MTAHQQINLYQGARRRRPPVHALQIAAAGLLVVLALAALSIYRWSQVVALEEEAGALAAERDTLEDRVADLTVQVQAVRDDTADGDEFERLQAELAAKRRLLDYLKTGPLAGRDGFSAHLEGLARRTVDDLWLSTIEISQGGSRLRFQGQALAPERVPELIAELGREEAYAGHSFRRLEIRRTAESPDRIHFSLASRPGDDDDSTEDGR